MCEQSVKGGQWEFDVSQYLCIVVHLAALSFRSKWAESSLIWRYVGLVRRVRAAKIVVILVRVVGLGVYDGEGGRGAVQRTGVVYSLDILEKSYSNHGIACLLCACRVYNILRL